MWVWVNSRSWWWTGRPGMLRFMGSQRVRHNWATELNWTHKAQIAWKGSVYTEVSAFVCLPILILSPIHKLSGKFQPFSLLHQNSPDHLVWNIRVGSSNVIAPLDMPPVQCLIRLGIVRSKDSYLQVTILGRRVLLKIGSDDSMKWREFEQPWARPLPGRPNI